MLLDGVAYDLSAGQLIIYAPNVYHIGDGNSSAQGDIISFDTTSPEMQLYYNRVITPSQNQKRMLLRIFSLSRGLYNNAPPNSGQRWMVPCDRAEVRDLQKLKNLMELFLLDLYQDLPKTAHTSSFAINHRRHQQSELNVLIHYMHTNIHRSLTLSQLSQSCSMSVDKIKRLFRQHYGCGPISYFTAIKIDTAKRLIEETTLNFTQISEQLGFHSVGYFSRLFKEKSGMTPSEYAHTQKNKL